MTRTAVNRDKLIEGLSFKMLRDVWQAIVPHYSDAMDVTSLMVDQLGQVRPLRSRLELYVFFSRAAAGLAARWVACLTLP